VAVAKNFALEGLRGVASLNVVVGHFLFVFFPYLGNDIRPYPGLAAKYWFEEVLRFPPFTFFYLADAAVSVFFVLSGYVLTRNFYETGRNEVLRAAASKRYLRLVLPALVSVIFAWLLLDIGAYATELAPSLNTGGWIMALYNKKVSFFYALKQGLIGAPLFGQNELNGPLWTIQIELIGSLLLFACYALFGLRGKPMAAICFTYVGLILTGLGTTMLNYEAILAGSFVHLVEPRLRSSPWLARACLVIGIVGVSFSHAPVFRILDTTTVPNLAPYGPDFNTDRVLLWHTIGALFLVAGVVGSASASRFFNHRIPVYFGRVSFSIYLLHFPLLLSLGLRTAQFGQYLGMDNWLYALLALVVWLAVLLSLAEIFYRFVDAPSMRIASWIAHRRGSGVIDGLSPASSSVASGAIDDRRASTRAISVK
jgi:peptidoglycan/LPS O-acetylase OafA/YrhL